MLWLSLHLPALPVEIFTRGGTPGAPLAVSDAHATHPRIIACDEAAIERGIRPGL
ncbi:MAG: DNA polymerase Y family protein, partial [Gammaproteobacteria bacterium]|nr:DNA polymerase Y family protein [Gammaproteobacteria bacterium]